MKVELSAINNEVIMNMYDLCSVSVLDEVLPFAASAEIKCC